MESAASDAQKRREIEASRKRQLASDEQLESSSKRRRLDPNGATGSSTASFLVNEKDNPLASFDVKTLDLQIVVDLVIASFEALSDERLVAAITVSRLVLICSLKMDSLTILW